MKYVDWPAALLIIAVLSFSSCTVITEKESTERIKYKMCIEIHSPTECRQ